MSQPFEIKSGNRILSLGSRTRLMGVLNVTPDSFYDGGMYFHTDDALRHALQLSEEGADILDIGGQSTRPGAHPVGVHEEIGRVLPLLKAIRHQTEAWISIDTYHSEVARICLEEGADMINDVSSFRMDPQMPSLLARYRVQAVCMHFLESIHPMPANPQYENVLEDIKSFFVETISIAEASGMKRDQIILDPGIGFGKTLEHNLTIIRQLSYFHPLGCPLLAGPSRKSFIGKLTGLPPEERLEGTAAAAAVCLFQGAHILRVHDVRFFRRFCDVIDSLLR